MEGMILNTPLQVTFLTMFIGRKKKWSRSNHTTSDVGNKLEGEMKFQNSKMSMKPNASTSLREGEASAVYADPPLSQPY
jgi:hypothetical protein